MKIPKYWAKGTQSLPGPDGRMVAFSCWHWSDVSVAEAQQKANARALNVAQKFLNHQTLDRYSYGDRPLREEVVQVVPGRSTPEAGLVTRNGYGALVLNTANVMFIDIDFPSGADGGSLVGRLKGLFGKPQPTLEERACQEIVAWARTRPDLGLRVYRTFGGLRCLVTNTLFDPRQEESAALMRSLKSDPLYIQLCRVQECFRARLTPKPWRCGVKLPPSRYPWENSVHEARYRAWEREYTQAASPYVVCKLLQQIGPRQVHPEVEPVLTLHDRFTCAAADRKLA